MTPILYSFRRCPYAMRARLALDASGQACELREVALREKPSQMLQASPTQIRILRVPAHRQVRAVDLQQDAGVHNRLVLVAERLRQRALHSSAWAIRRH
ncbi:MAG TPA: glutathione S-transferase N-terminal domain-containing protein [Steroidobacteraceae bacterium]|nr:glutathione S-transferase N-terminal domain-containing protein [Steroidobacteraceae bacterium]